jgi:hypothetical protein
MFIRRLSFMALAGMLALALWALAGCGGSSSGTGQLQVRLVDAPLAADEVNVTITGIQVHETGGGWVTVKEYDPPLEVNLLEYASSGQSLLLADEPLDAGHYTMVRLMLSSAEVVIGSGTFPVDLTNVEQTGVKCNGQFTVEEGQLMALMLDFNAASSFVDTGGGTYMLHPVMTMSPVDIATQVTGKVEFQDGSGNPIALPADVTVRLYLPDHAGDDAYLVGNVSVETDGSFELDVIAQGTYDLQVYQADTAVKTVEDVIITAPTTDLGTIIVPPSP